MKHLFQESLVTPNSKLREELEHGPNNVCDGDMASELESLYIADGNSEKKTLHRTNSGKNLIEQSTNYNGESVVLALTSSSLSASNHGGCVHPLKKLQAEIPTGSSLSDKTCKATPARREIGSRRIRKPVVPFNIETGKVKGVVSFVLFLFFLIE